MKPYTPNTNKGRTMARDDVHHKTRDCPKSEADCRAKSMRKAARREGKLEAKEELPND